jgi:hypothetical protein
MVHSTDGTSFDVVAEGAGRLVRGGVLSEVWDDEHAWARVERGRDGRLQPMWSFVARAAGAGRAGDVMRVVLIPADPPGEPIDLDDLTSVTIGRQTPGAPQPDAVILRFRHGVEVVNPIAAYTTIEILEDES